jgi:pyridoxal phosphate enzyme (YggS family)
LAVSKTRTSAEVSECMDLGQTRFGENQLQEALTKISDLGSKAPEWHFIGHIQSNKTARIAEHFAWVHSVDRLKLAHRLNDQRPPELPPLNICLQVNVSNETSKSGVSPAALEGLASEVATLSRLRLRGLMCIPAPSTDPTQQRIPFRQLRELLQALNQGGLALDTLSMGMTDDMQAAIAEGATMVRIGTALFGPRRYR